MTTTTKTTDPAVSAAEQRLAELREQVAKTVDAIAAAERDLAPAAAALEAARAVYAVAGGELAAAQAPLGWRPPVEGEPWSTIPEGQRERARLSADEARAAFDQADLELGAALVAYNAANQRRGDLKAHGRYLEGQVEPAAAALELAQSRAAAGPGRDLLATIRRRLDPGGGD